MLLSDASIFSILLFLSDTGIFSVFVLLGNTSIFNNFLQSLFFSLIFFLVYNFLSKTFVF